MIEFIPDYHVYLVDGVITPSVTQIIRGLMGDMYSNIPQYILNAKADYGNTVHDLIECYSLGKNVDGRYNTHSYESIALKRFKTLQEENSINIHACEQPMVYYHEGNPLYCGTYDMIGTVDGKHAIIDIKTTYQYHPLYLSYQLTLYKMAYEQMTGEKIEKAYCVWLPKKDLGQLYEVELLDEQELLKVVTDSETAY